MLKTSQPYQIAVIGPTPRDHITTFKNKVIEKYGCITYPVILLAKLFAGTARIYPVSHIRKPDEAAIKQLFRNLPGVDSTHISSTADRGDVIKLRFLDQNERVKTMSAFMNPIIPADIKHLTACDAFLFLPVTDFEIALETLQFIKENSQGLVIFDAHGQTKTVTSLGDRLFKFWVDRDRWLPYIDILKMNLREAKYCAFKHRYSLEELEDDEPISMDCLPEFAAYCFSKGVKAIYITMDSRGCLVYTQEDGKVKEQLVPAVTINNIIDSTGCGGLVCWWTYFWATNHW